TLLKLLPVFIFALPGVIALALFPSRESKTTFVTLLNELLPTGIRGLVLAALLASLIGSPVCDELRIYPHGPRFRFALPSKNRRACASITRAAGNSGRHLLWYCRRLRHLQNSRRAVQVPADDFDLPHDAGGPCDRLRHSQQARHGKGRTGFGASG